MPRNSRKSPKHGRYQIDPFGWCNHAERRDSPHFDARPTGEVISLLVIHGISLPPGIFGGSAIDRLFMGAIDSSCEQGVRELEGLRVSAHFVIRRDGTLIQYVSTLKRAWHAGVSSFCGRERCNDFSIGVELEGADHIPYTPKQYDILARLTHALRRRHPISALVGHSDIAPGRKTDPGEAFNWPLFAQRVRLSPAWMPFW